MNVTYYDKWRTGDQPLTGEVWSPGPNKRTLWVRAEDGQYVVVHMDSRQVLHNPRTDPRFEHCPGHWRYSTTNKANPWTRDPGKGVRLECPDCAPSARQDYVRTFRPDRRDFTQAERARCAALFAI